MDYKTTKAHRLYVLAIFVTLAFFTSTASYAQPASTCCSIQAFSKNMVGDWVGTIQQSTDGQKTDTRYFHAVVKQSEPCVFETTFEYYKIDPNNSMPVQIGTATMTTRMAADGTATNTIVGKGEVQLDARTVKPEQHEFTETLRLCSSGCLQGVGGGNLSVSGMPLGLGKHGKVQDLHSTWSLCDGVLKISQSFKVGFRVLIADRNYTITNEFKARRGTDIGSLMAGAGAAKD